MSLMAEINFSLVVGEVQGLKLQVHLADVSTGGALLVTRSFSKEVLSGKGFCGAVEFDTE